jgi:hypothetical protein
MRLSTLSIWTGVSALVAAGTMIPSPAPAFSTGIDLGAIGLSIQTAPACALCHNEFQINANNLEVSLVPAERSLTPGQVVSVTTSATGGVANPFDYGGFSTEASSGTFTPVAGISQLSFNPNVITHVDGRTDQDRTWTYDFNAPTTPGLVDVYTVVNTVNGDFDTGGDIVGFHGPDNMVNTPVRLFVNAQGVQPIGQSCEGGFGNYPVLGCPTPSQIGNTGFTVEVHGVPGGTPVWFFFGLDPNPVPLSVGALLPGCEFLTPLDAPNPLFVATATPGSGPRAEGVASIALPIPNLPTITPGDQFVVQGLVLDLNAPGQLPFTVTNGVVITLF